MARAEDKDFYKKPPNERLQEAQVKAKQLATKGVIKMHQGADWLTNTVSTFVKEKIKERKEEKK